jgi:hypothetical protein
MIQLPPGERLLLQKTMGRTPEHLRVVMRIETFHTSPQMNDRVRLLIFVGEELHHHERLINEKVAEGQARMLTAGLVIVDNLPLMQVPA